MPESTSNPTPFHRLDDYIALPRVESLALSPDGQRAVLTVATLSSDATAYQRSLWSVPADGSGVPTRLTRSAKGEAGSAFTASGDVLFVSGRPDSAASDSSEASQLWILPAAGGEARAVTRLAGGVSGVAATARDSDTVVVSASLLPGADDFEADAALRAKRDDKKVRAILHDRSPVRFWDHDLGPDESHLLALDLSEGALAETVAKAAGHRDNGGGDAGADSVATEKEGDAHPTLYAPDLPRPRDLTPHPGPLFADTAGQALTPDGRTLVVAAQVPEQRTGRTVLFSIDVATGERTLLVEEPGVDFESPTVSRDGTRLAYLRTPRSTPEAPRDSELWVSAIDGTDPVRLAAEWDHWVTSLVFDLGDDALVVTADHEGRGPIFRIPLTDTEVGAGQVERLTDDVFAYTHVAIDERTGDLVALRSSWTTPSHPVRLDREGRVLPLATPAPLPEVPGSLTEVETTTADGSRVRGWLVLPEGASPEHPAPLLLWIHGGPLGSWNAWSWRWNALLMAAKGYAVLLPDPALSTGYGLDFIARGWNAWGAAPYTDLLAITDAVDARDDIDETRTAAMGGSFGGYMANWVAGHTDRFRAIVTHASLWALDQFAGTTDNPYYWQSIFTPEAMIENSPHRFVEQISTPMLVVHGDRDYRVPIGEGLRLWSELTEHHAEDDGSTVHRFLYFPDENHWVLKPQHAVVWYETVLAFLDVHVHGAEWKRPELLG
ncbi:S9 family peptidase [Frondihabitans cladoniiphilus]|uniref:S9 family peptidase n=1 Tax=Frondihabitans cladoniiphilus TaxID=715785 RepID=A0ABP8WA82_9MICO